MNPAVYNYLILLGLCLIGSAFFSGAETALLSLPRARVLRLAQSGRKSGKLIQRAVNQPDQLLGAILLGNNLCNIVGTAAGTAAALEMWPQRGLTIATVALTLIYLIAAEITPKTIAAFKPESFSTAVIHPLDLFIRLSRPLVWALTLVSRILLRMMGRPTAAQASLSRDDFRILVRSGRRDGYLSDSEQKMFKGILDLSLIPVAEVMKPINRVKCLDVNLTLDQAVLRTAAGRYSRYPIYDSDPEQIIGYVHMRDLFHQKPGTALRDLVHPPVYVPESRTVQAQLLDFRVTQVHMAFVVDEFGRVIGVVTLEDVLEEIVGEIVDEYDQETFPLKPLPGGGFMLGGRLTLREVKRLTGLELPIGPYHTVSGLIQTAAQKIPAAGETYHVGQYSLTVAVMDGKAVGLAEVKELADYPD